MAEFGKLGYGAKKTRAVSGYLTVARMRRTVTIPSELHPAPLFGQKEAKNSTAELGFRSWNGLNAGPD